MSFQLFSQRDPRWDKLLLGRGPDTIGQAGCFVTVLAMIVYDAYGDMHYTPATLDAVLHFVQGDLLTDDALEQVWPTRFAHQSIPGFAAGSIAAAVQSPSSYAVLWISNPAIGVPTHFLIAWSPSAAKTADPWIGGIDALAGYGGPAAVHKTLIITKTQAPPHPLPTPPVLAPPTTVPKPEPIPMAIYAFDIGPSPAVIPQGMFWIPPPAQATILADAISQADDWSSSHGSAAIKVHVGDIFGPVVYDLPANVVPGGI